MAEILVTASVNAAPLPEWALPIIRERVRKERGAVKVTASVNGVPLSDEDRVALLAEAAPPEKVGPADMVVTASVTGAPVDDDDLALMDGVLSATEPIEGVRAIEVTASVNGVPLTDEDFAAAAKPEPEEILKETRRYEPRVARSLARALDEVRSGIDRDALEDALARRDVKRVEELLGDMDGALLKRGAILSDAMQRGGVFGQRRLEGRRRR